eukprot:365682-Chlamydomonas_euryale.AAC.5
MTFAHNISGADRLRMVSRGLALWCGLGKEGRSARYSSILCCMIIQEDTWRPGVEPCGVHVTQRPQVID